MKYMSEIHLNIDFFGLFIFCLWFVKLEFIRLQYLGFWPTKETKSNISLKKLILENYKLLIEHFES